MGSALADSFWASEGEGQPEQSKGVRGGDPGESPEPMDRTGLQIRARDRVIAHCLAACTYAPHLLQVRLSLLPIHPFVVCRLSTTCPRQPQYSDHRSVLVTPTITIKRVGQ